MRNDNLIIKKKPQLSEPQLVMGFSGWMNGGDVSTGAVDYLIKALEAEKITEIRPDGFYIHNFPGTMEITALFRPYCMIKEGLVEEYDLPANTFYCSEEHNLTLFTGNEPNINWSNFADCIFSFCRDFGVKRILFIGSVAGLVPHTREPWVFCSVSAPAMKKKLDNYGIKFSNYQGPASFITYLTTQAPANNLEMVTLVATIPAYVQGYNPACIESILKKLSAILGIHLELKDLQVKSDEFEKKLSTVIQEQPELAESIIKLEEDYDNEVFDSEMGDLKKWLQKKGIRVD